MDPKWERSEIEVKMSRALEKVAAEVGAKSITAGQSLLSLPSVIEILKVSMIFQWP